MIKCISIDGVKFTYKSGRWFTDEEVEVLDSKLISKLFADFNKYKLLQSNKKISNTNKIEVLNNTESLKVDGHLDLISDNQDKSRLCEYFKLYLID